MKRLALLIALLFPDLLIAQTAVAPMPMEPKQFFDNNGVPVAGGYLCTYVTGTTTPLATYTDSTGNTQNANPVHLDSAGRAQVWLSQSTYRFVLQDSTGSACAGVVIWTVNGVSAYTFLGQANTWTATQTFNT